IKLRPGASVATSRLSGAPNRPPACPASRKRAKRQASVALPMPRGPVSSQAWCSLPTCCAASIVRSAVSWPTSRSLRHGGGQSYGHSSFSNSAGSALTLARAIASGSQPLVDDTRDRGGDGVDVLRGVDHRAALGFVAGDGEEPVAHPLVELL